MYAYPIYLPEFSNREDLLVSASLFDDDTGDPIDLSGRTLAMPGDFTASLWLVTVGAIATQSTTTLTIPDYPIGSQLVAVALTVAPGLAILPGDPLTIADLPAGVGGTPGPNTMTGYVTSYAVATGALVAQIGNTYQCEIRRLKRNHDFDYAYTSSWDYLGGASDTGPVIMPSLGNGLMVTDIGVLQIRVPELIFRKLNHRTYGLYLTMTDSYDTRQVFVAQLPVQFGGVST